MVPLLEASYRRDITFTQNVEWVLTHDTASAILIVGWFAYRKSDLSHEWLRRIRDKYRIVTYFDDNDSAEILHARAMPYVDRYFKKQTFRQASRYQQDFYGNRVFADYYHRTFGVTEDPVPPALHPIDPETIRAKLRLAWNLAIGDYPLSGPRQRIAHLAYRLAGTSGLRAMRRRFPTRPPATPSIPRCHARFGASGYRPTVGYQRKLFLEQVFGADQFLSGRVAKRQYRREIRRVQAVLSPFGWGEVCFRDVEAVRNGAVLVKPTMDHLETWPDLYRPKETYVPVSWDGSDLIETVDALLKDAPQMERLRTTAWQVLRDSYGQLTQRADGMIEEILNAR